MCVSVFVLLGVCVHFCVRVCVYVCRGNTLLGNQKPTIAPTTVFKYGVKILCIHYIVQGETNISNSSKLIKIIHRG